MVNLFICSELITAESLPHFSFLSTPPFHSLHICEFPHPLDPLLKLRAEMSLLAPTFIHQLVPTNTHFPNVLLRGHHPLPLATTKLFTTVLMLKEKYPNSSSADSQEIECECLEEMIEWCQLGEEEMQMHRTFSRKLALNIQSERTKICLESLRGFAARLHDHHTTTVNRQLSATLVLLHRVHLHRRQSNLNIVKEYFNKWIICFLEDQIRNKDQQIQENRTQIRRYKELLRDDLG